MALRFPTLSGLLYPVKETIVDRVRISEYANRAEQRQSMWSQPYHIFPIRCEPVKTDFLRIWEFYQLCRGPYKAFQFDNDNDQWAPLKNVEAYWALNEAEGARVNDRHGFINPTYSCRFMDDSLSYEQVCHLLVTSGIQIVQESPLSFTNNYGTLMGAATWIQCPDGSAGVNFDGSSGWCSIGNLAVLNVGTGNFSIAFGVYVNSFAFAVGLLSKKESAASGHDGYSMIIETNGQLTFRLSDGAAQNTVVSAIGAVPVTTWKIIMITVDRAASGQIYVNNVASGPPVTITADANADNSRVFHLGAVENVSFGNARIRNCLFQKKVWTEDERNHIWNTWKGTFQI
jgi:hypothetical protein